MIKDPVGDIYTGVSAITIPPGQFEAPFDYKLFSTTVRVGNEEFSVPTIEQHNSSNCTEYSILQSALLAKSFGFRTSEEIDIYLEGKKNLHEAIDSYERGFVLHMLYYAHKYGAKATVTESNRRNLKEKATDIYHPLDGTNAMLLFTSVFKGLEDMHIEENFVFEESLKKLLEIQKALVIFEGDTEKGHATTRILVAEQSFSLNTSRHGNVIGHETKEETIEFYKMFLNGNNYILVYVLEND